MKKKITIVLLLLLVETQAMSFNFDGGNLVNSAKDISKKAKNIKSKVDEYKQKYLNLTNGIGFDNFDLNGFNTSFSASCDLPKPSANFDICDMIQKSTGFDIFGQLSKTISIGKCKASLSTGLGDELNDMFRNMCDVGRQNPEVSWSVHEVNMEKLLEEKAYNKVSKPAEVTTEYGEKIKMKTTSYKNGQTTQSLFGQNGILTHKAISLGKVPTAMRQAYARDDVAVYDAYLNAAKTYKTSDRSKQLDLSIGVPKTYIEYEAKKQALILEYETLVPSRRDYEGKVRKEINELKQKYNFSTLDGDSSSAMLQDYNQKLQKISTDLLSLDTKKDKNGLDTPKTEYGKYIKGLRQYERIKFLFKEDEYRRTHKTIVQPSRQKVMIQPQQNQIKYASRIMMQQRREINDEIKFNEMFEKKKNYVADFTIKIFYESLKYRPEIAQKEIEELLK